jgi:hypothetical protein
MLNYCISSFDHFSVSSTTFLKYEIFMSHFPDFCRKIFQKIAKCDKCDGQCEPWFHWVNISYPCISWKLMSARFVSQTTSLDSVKSRIRKGHTVILQKRALFVTVCSPRGTLLPIAKTITSTILFSFSLVKKIKN